MNDHDGVAVNVEVVVMPSIVNDSGAFGLAYTVRAHVVIVPVASVWHAAAPPKMTWLGWTARTVMGCSVAANPVPVTVKTAGRGPLDGVNDHDGVAVNVEVVASGVPPVAGLVLSTTKDSAVFGAFVTVIVHDEKVPVASVVQAACE